MTATTVARAWRIQRTDGLTLGFTDHDRTLSFDGMTFRPDHGLSARALVQGTGLSVDNSEAVGGLSDDAINERDLLAGRWDKATLRMWEVDWQEPAACRLIFAGSLGEISRQDGAFRAELRGLSEPLNASRGRVYQPLCAARLGDERCKIGFDRTPFQVERDVESGEDGRMFSFATFPGFETDWFERGTLEVMTGDATGLSGAVKNDRAVASGGREIELWQALPIMPLKGDRIRLKAGCDKQAATCRLKFNNFLNFRGFPHLPTEDWLMTPGTGTKNG